MRLKWIHLVRLCGNISRYSKHELKHMDCDVLGYSINYSRYDNCQRICRNILLNAGYQYNLSNKNTQKILICGVQNIQIRTSVITLPKIKHV